MPLQNRRPRVKTQGYTKDVPKPGLKGRFGHASKHNGAPAGSRGFGIRSMCSPVLKGRGRDFQTTEPCTRPRWAWIFPPF